MNKANPMYEISRALVKTHSSRYRAAMAVNKKTPIRMQDALLLLAGDKSPTLDELAELAELAGLKVQVVVTVPKESGEVAA